MVKAELADAQRQAIRDEHEKAVQLRANRTIKTLTAPNPLSKNNHHPTLVKTAHNKNQAVLNSNTANINTNVQLSLENRILYLLALKPVTLDQLLQRLKASNSDEVKQILTRHAWQDPISMCYSIKKEATLLVKPKTWPLYSPRERLLVADNILKLQMTGEYGSLPNQTAVDNAPTPSNSKAAKGVKGRIEKVISRIRK